MRGCLQGCAHCKALMRAYKASDLDKDSYVNKREFPVLLRTEADAVATCAASDLWEWREIAKPSSPEPIHRRNVIYFNKVWTAPSSDPVHENSKK